jgi:hypothetical protein
MTDSVAVLPVLVRATDTFGVPIPGATLHFFETGTDTPRNVYGDADLSAVPLGAIVYTDAGGYPVTAEGSGTKTGIFTGIGNYDIVVKNESDVEIITHDNWPGAIDTSGFAGGDTVEQSVLGLSKSANYTIVADDNGYLIEFDSTGGDCVATLPSAVDVGNGFYVGIRHNGTGNEVIVFGAQTIRHMGAASTRIPLVALGETIWLHSNGATWVVYAYVPRISNATGIITITDRLSAPPSHVVGARYILTAAPSGAWLSFAENDIVEDDGTNWFKRTPPADCGWIAYVQDEDLSYQFVGSVWQAMITKSATQAAMEAGTSVVEVVTPGWQKHHRMHAKAVGTIGITGNVVEGAGIASATDNGVGDVSLTWTTAFSTDTYEVNVSAQASNNVALRLSAQTTGGCRILCVSLTPAAFDPTYYHVSAFGDLA